MIGQLPFIKVIRTWRFPLCTSLSAWAVVCDMILCQLHLLIRVASYYFRKLSRSA
jgi:hypothetical protein